MLPRGGEPVDFPLQEGGIRSAVPGTVVDKATALPELLENQQYIGFNQAGVLREIRGDNPATGGFQQIRRDAAQKLLDGPGGQFASRGPGEREKLLEDHLRGARAVTDNRVERAVADLV